MTYSVNETYRRALAYARKCCAPLHKDIVHDAWLRNYKRDGSNLFERDIYIVLRWVRNVWFNEIRDGKYMKDGVLYKKQFQYLDDPNSFFELRSPHNSPETLLTSKEFYENLFRKIDHYSSGWNASIDNKILRQVLEYFDQGYGQVEIGKLMGMSTQRIHYYKNKLKTIISQMEIRNPFAASKVKISKRVTRRVFEAHPEKYAGYSYQPDFDCDYNEYFIILYNGTDYLLVKENGKD